MADLPADVVLRVVAQLPAHVARLVSRAARDAVDADAESLELEWRSPWTAWTAETAEGGPPDSLGTFDALLRNPRFARVERLEFRDARGISCATSFLQALRRRDEERTRVPLLRQLSVASDVTGTWAASVEADLALALALESLPRPLERLDLGLPSLALPARLIGAIGSMARGLRELSLGHLGQIGRASCRERV